MAAQVGAAPIYIGGAALAYGFMYAIDPEFRDAHANLGAAMAQGAGDAIDSISDLIFGDDSDERPQISPQTSIETTTTETAQCPLTPFYHYTDLVSGHLILDSRIFLPGLAGGVYLTQGGWGPVTLSNVLFIANPLYSHKSAFFISLQADCTVPITLSTENPIGINEFFHPGPLRERPPNVIIGVGGPNRFPEHPLFRDLTLP